MSAANINLPNYEIQPLISLLSGMASNTDALTSMLHLQQREETRQLVSAQKEGIEDQQIFQYLKAIRQEVKSTGTRLINALASEQSAVRNAIAGIGKGSISPTANTATTAYSAPTLAQSVAAVSGLYAVTETTGSNIKQTRQTATDKQAEFSQINKEYQAAQKKLANKEAAHQKNIANIRNRDTRNLSNALRTTGTGAQQTASTLRSLQQSAIASSQALKQQNQKLDKLNKQRDKARIAAAEARLESGLAKASILKAGAAASVTPISRAITVEAAMNNLTKSGDLEGTSEKALQSGLMTLSVDANIPPEQLIQIAADGRRGGIKDKDLLAFTQSAAQTAVALDMAPQDAANTLTSWQVSMGLSQEGAVELANSVNYVSDKMKVSGQDVANIVSNQGKAAQKAGLTDQETAGLAGALLSGGATGEAASATMGNILSTLTSGEAATHTQKTALTSLDFDSATIATEMTSDADGTITKVLEAISKAPQAQQELLTSQLFGEGSITSILPMLDNMQWLQDGIQLSTDANKIDPETNQAKGSVQTEYEKSKENVAHKIGSAWRAIDRLGVALAENLLPVIGPVADGIMWAANGLAAFAEGGTLQSLSVAIGGLVVAGGLYFAKQKAQKMLINRLAGSLDKAANKETKLASATDITARKANSAANALNKFNNTLARTARNSSDSRGGKRNKKNHKKKAHNSNGSRSTTINQSRTDSSHYHSGDNRLGDNRSGDNRSNTVSSNSTHSNSTGSTGYRSTGSNNSSTERRNATIKKGGKAAFISTGLTSLMSLVGLGSLFTAEPVLASPPPVPPSDNPSGDTAPDNNTKSENTPSATDSAVSFSNLLMPLAGLAATFIRPINTVMKAGQLTKAVAKGKTDKLGELAGDVAGGVGGAWAGAAMGATIGSAVPIVGTAIGGLIGATLGGIAGNEGGSWIGEKLSNWFSDNESGDALKQADQQLIQNQQTQNQQQSQTTSSQQTQQVTISPNITVNAAPGMDAELLAETVLQKINLSFKQALPAFNSSLDGTLDNDMRLTA